MTQGLQEGQKAKSYWKFDHSHKRSPTTIHTSGSFRMALINIFRRYQVRAGRSERARCDIQRWSEMRNKTHRINSIYTDSRLRKALIHAFRRCKDRMTKNRVHRQALLFGHVGREEANRFSERGKGPKPRRFTRSAQPKACDNSPTAPGV
jgi:hypothetical protein